MEAVSVQSPHAEERVPDQHKISKCESRVAAAAPSRAISLDTLPEDLLSHVVSFSDVQTALAFARIAPGFAAAADAKLWEKLDLDIYTNHAVSSPHAKVKARWTWVESTEETVVRSQRKFDTLQLADEGRWGHVRALRLCPQSGFRGMTEILDRVSSKLVMLAIDRPAGQPLPEHEHAALTSWLVRPSTVFNSVTSLRLGPGAISSLELIPLFCKAMPGLLCLDIAVPNMTQSGEQPATPARRIEYTTDTRVRRIRLTYDHWESKSGDETQFDPIITLLHRSPRISQMIFAYPAWLRQPPTAFISAIVLLPQLEDLYWQADVWSGSWQAQNVLHRASVSEPFPELRRLIIHCGSNDDGISGSTPVAPKLEVILYDWNPRPRTHFPGMSRVENNGVNRGLVNTLELHPRLHTLQYHAQGGMSDKDGLEFFSTLDAIVRNERQTGRIHSYHHGESEHLLHVQTIPPSRFGYNRHVGFVNRWEQAPIFAGEPELERTPELQSADVSRLSFTHYRGVSVPLDIIYRMREVEKMASDQWANRGVEVGEKAWQVLLDWYDVAESERLQVLDRMGGSDMLSSEESSAQVGGSQGGWKVAAYARIVRQHDRITAKKAALLAEIRRENKSMTE